MKNRFLILLLASAMLTSCGANEISTVRDITAKSSAEETTLPSPEYEDLGGAKINMIYFSNEINHGWSGIPNDLNTDETTGDILNDSVYSRNRKVEEKLNITITAEAAKQGYDQLTKAVQSSVMAGDNAYDLAFPNIVSIVGMADSGLLRDFMKIDVNLSSGWYDQKLISELTIAEKLFYIESDISYIDKLATIGVYFNKSIVDDYGLSDYYKLVTDGGWTYDKMVTDAAQITSDADGNGVMDQNDTFGISCQNDGSYYLFEAAGLKIGEKDGDSLRFSAGDERAVTALQNIFDLMASDNYFNSHKFNYSIADITQMYAEDKALFLIRPLQSVFNLREMTSDFGIIPMPKYFEEDTSYHSPMNIYPGTIMVVPKNTANEDYIGTVIDVLAAESYNEVMPSFYDTVLDTKLVRDETSSLMLDIIFDNRIYDFGLIFDLGGLRSKITTTEYLNISSTIASIKPAAEKQADELYQMMVNAEG